MALVLCGLLAFGACAEPTPSGTALPRPTPVPTTAPLALPLDGSLAPTEVDMSTASELVAVPPQEPDPVTVRIPAIGVDAIVEPLALLGDGTIEVPANAADTGWWRDGPEPGEPGPAVILGHVDSYDGPGVFYRLGSLRAGDLIHIDRVDGSTVTYRVDGIEQYPKASFPTEAVYGSASQPLLRLITCGGFFDRGESSYLDNVVVFAHLA